MMKLFTVFAIAVSLTVPASRLPTVPPGPIHVAVDCNAGDELARVLGDAGEKARASTPLVINFRGTCTGNLTITRDNLTLRGASPEESILEGLLDKFGGPVGPVVTANNVQHLLLESLTLRQGDVGLQAEYSVVRLRNCRVTNREVGLISTDGTLTVEQSVVASHIGSGIVVLGGGSATIVDTILSDNQNADIFLNSAHAVIGGGTMSSLEVDLGSIADVARVSGLERIFLANKSELKIRLSPVTGEIVAAFDSFLEFSNATLTGEIFLSSFSKAVILAATVTGEVTCESGGDVACLLSSVDTVNGCGGCQAP